MSKDLTYDEHVKTEQDLALSRLRTADAELDLARLLRVMSWNPERFEDGARTEHFRRASLDSGLIKLYSAMKSVRYWQDPSAEETKAISDAIRACDEAIEKMEKQL